jgi:hypothetical protein
MDPLSFTAAEVILGIGILGLYGFVYKVELAARKRTRDLYRVLNLVAIEVKCLKALHIEHHPEDKALLEEVCKETPS